MGKCPACLRELWELRWVGSGAPTEAGRQGASPLLGGGLAHLPGAMIRGDPRESRGTPGTQVRSADLRSPSSSLSFSSSRTQAGAGPCWHRWRCCSCGRKRKGRGRNLLPGECLPPSLPEKWNFGSDTVAGPLCYWSGLSFR